MLSLLMNAACTFPTYVQMMIRPTPSQENSVKLFHTFYMLVPLCLWTVYCQERLVNLIVGERQGGIMTNLKHFVAWWLVYYLVYFMALSPTLLYIYLPVLSELGVRWSI